MLASSRKPGAAANRADIYGLRAGPAVRLASETRLRAQWNPPLHRFLASETRGVPG